MTAPDATETARRTCRRCSFVGGALIETAAGWECVRHQPKAWHAERRHEVREEIAFKRLTVMGDRLTL